MLKRLSNTNLFFLSHVSYMIYFWVAISVPFMISRGLSNFEALTIMSVYSLFVVLFEYPTGIIGDYYSHKLSVILGRIIEASAFIIVIFSYTFEAFLLAMLVKSIGQSLTSGSDQALLKSISGDYKKTFTMFNTSEDIILALTALLAGLIADLNLNVAIAIQIFLTAGSSIFIVFIKVPDTKNNKENKDSNIFSHALEGFESVISNKLLLIFVFIFTAIYAVGRNTKTMLQSLYDVYNLDLSQIGYIIAIRYFARALGRYVALKLKVKDIYLISILTFTVLLVSAVPNLILAVIGLILADVGLGILYTKLKYNIAILADDKHRASVLSFANLINRLESAGYLILFALVLTEINFSIAIIMTTIYFFVVLLIYMVYMKVNKLKFE